MTTRRSWLGGLAAVHDGITRVGFFCAGICLGLIVITYCYEVVARYFFSSPTTWASSLVSYLLCYTVFLALPELSRQRVHIVISIVLDVMPSNFSKFLQRCAYGLAAAACLLAAAFSLDATWNQYARGIQTVNEWRVLKWPLSIAIPYGLFSTSIYYMRHLLSGEGLVTTDAAQL